jgi:signal transduction histidine kinase
MKQILVNLLSNAIKFTPAEKSIGIDVDKERDFIIFAVWDEGIGIKEGDIDQLFRPFTQIDSKLSRRYVGTGLGLALVNSLVNFHNGSIRVQSQLDVGSRFIVSIPVKDNK